MSGSGLGFRTPCAPDGVETWSESGERMDMILSPFFTRMSELARDIFLKIKVSSERSLGATALGENGPLFVLSEPWWAMQKTCRQFFYIENFLSEIKERFRKR